MCTTVLVRDISGTYGTGPLTLRAVKFILVYFSISFVLVETEQQKGPYLDTTYKEQP